VIEHYEVPLRIDEWAAFLFVEVGHQVFERVQAVELVGPLYRIGSAQVLFIDFLQLPAVRIVLAVAAR
jgi:hypothetical protein